MWEGGGSPWVVRDGGWKEGGKVLLHNEMLPRGRDGKKHKNLQDAPRRPYGRLGVVADFVFFPIPSTRQHFIV